MNFRDHLNQFFQGRYGTDTLNRFLLILFWVFVVLYLFTGWFWANTITLVIAVWSLFRMLSRNYARRSAENQKFLEITAPIREKFNKMRNPAAGTSTSAGYKIFVCPTCRQKLRVPKGKGKIKITCPKCHGDFVKRS